MELIVNLAMVVLALMFVLLIVVGFTCIVTRDYTLISATTDFCKGVLLLPYNLLPLDLIIKNLRGEQ